MFGAETKSPFSVNSETDDVSVSNYNLVPRTSPLVPRLGPQTTDLKKGLDRATYCFRTQVFEVIGAILVGPNL